MKYLSFATIFAEDPIISEDDVRKRFKDPKKDYRRLGLSSSQFQSSAPAVSGQVQVKLFA